MAVERSKIAAVLRSIRVDYFGEAITVTYKPDFMTPAKEAELARLKQLAEENHNGDGDIAKIEDGAARMADLIVSWDIVEDGEPLPPTKEVLMTFPSALWAHIIAAVNEDMAPKARTFRR
jgi:hypothetical protein